MQVTSAVRKQEGHRRAPDRALGGARLVPAPEMLLRFLISLLETEKVCDLGVTRPRFNWLCW